MLLICYVGAVVSAFASTTGILGALIPLAVPFLETGAIGAVGLSLALIAPPVTWLVFVVPGWL